MNEAERRAASEKYYQDLRKKLDERIRSDKQLQKIAEKVANKTADFNDTAKYSEIASNHLANVLQENIGEINSPLAKEYVCKELLRDQHSAINELFGSVQVSIDEQNGIHIKTQKPAFPQERVDKVAHALEDPTVSPKTTKRRAGAPVANVSKSFHDDCVKKNATFRNDAGLTCYIIREGSNCCEWCSSVAGKYRFGTQPDDIFRRHDNCDCTIIYDGQVLRGRQNADGSRSKTWEEVPNADSSYNPTVLSPEEAKRLQAKNQPKILTNGKKRVTISGRGSGTGSTVSDNHTYEKIGEINFNDKKAVAESLAEFERKYSNSDIEHCRVICKNGEVYEVHGDRYRVDTELLGDKMSGSINEHNHVTGESQHSFSWEDLDSSVKDGSHITLAYDEKYRYSMTFPDRSISADALREAYDISENEVELNNYKNQYFSIGSRISDEDFQHEVIRRTCERVGVKYERKLKA